MTSYISQTEITLEKYIDMSIHPIGKSARNNLKRWKAAKIGGTALMAVTGAMCALSGRKEFAIIAAMLGLTLLYQLLIQRKQIIKKQYKTTTDAMTEEKWIRTITFDDKITVADGNTSTSFAYSDYKWADENDKYYLVYRNENVVLRIEKGSFIHGDEKSFLRWINNKLK